MRWNRKQVGVIAATVALGACASGPTEVKAGRPPAVDQPASSTTGVGAQPGSLPPGWKELKPPTSAKAGKRKGQTLLIGEPTSVPGATERSAALFLYDPSEEIGSVEDLASEVRPGAHGRTVAAGRGLLVHLDADIEVPRPDGQGVRVDSAWVARLPGGRYAQVMASGLTVDEVRDLVGGLQ